MERQPSLDIIRGLAIFSMVGIHMAVSPYFNMTFMSWLGIIVTPLFLMAAGTSSELFVESRSSKFIEMKLIYLELFCRALTLYTISITGLFVGHLFLPKIYPVFEFFSWGLIQLIAIGYILSIPLSKNSKLIFPLIILIFMLTFVSKIYFPTQLSFLTIGFRPFLPYIGFFWFGQIIYNNFYSNSIVHRTDNKTIICIYSYIVYLCYIFCYLFRIDIYNTIFYELFLFLLTSAIYISLTIFLKDFIDEKGKEMKILYLLERPGKIAFTIYYTHMPFIFFLILPLLNFFHISNRLIIMSISILTISSLFIIFATIENIWRQQKYILGAEWFLRNGTEMLMKLVIIIVKNLRIHIYGQS